MSNIFARKSMAVLKGEAEAAPAGALSAVIGLAIYFFHGMRHSRVGNEPQAA